MKTLRLFRNFCIGTFVGFILIQVLEFLGHLSTSLICQWLLIFATYMQFPYTEIDWFLKMLNIENIPVIIGFICLIWLVIDKFTEKRFV